MPRTFEPLEGRVDGTLLTFVKYSHTHPVRGRYSVFQCICGNKKTILEWSVRHKHTKSCGCIRRTQGEPSRLTYLSHDHYKSFPCYQGEKRTSYGLYQCTCGNKKVIQDNLVTQKITRSCGCLRKDLAGRVDQILEAHDNPKPGETLDTINGKEELIRIEEPQGSGNWIMVTEQQLSDMFWGLDEQAA